MGEPSAASLEVYKGFYVRHRYDKLIVNEKDWLNLDLASNDVVLDVGAYIGTFAARVAPFVKSVYCYEPDPSSFQLLSLNTGELKNVCRVHAAVTQDGALTTRLMQATAPYSNSVVRGKAETGVIVPAVDWQAVLDVLSPTIIKMDIEGGEFSLDFSSLPATVRTLALELHPTRKVWQQVGVPKIRRQLENQGFKPVVDKRAGQWRQNVILVVKRG